MEVFVWQRYSNYRNYFGAVALIERCNSIIVGVKNIEMSSNSTAEILREVYVYRAYAYFWLLHRYDNIWLNTEATTAENFNKREFKVAPKKDVYDLIVLDLDEAITLYGNDWNVIPGRFSLGAACLLRADVACG